MSVCPPGCWSLGNPQLVFSTPPFCGTPPPPLPRHADASLPAPAACAGPSPCWWSCRNSFSAASSCGIAALHTQVCMALPLAAHVSALVEAGPSGCWRMGAVIPSAAAGAVTHSNTSVVAAEWNGSTGRAAGFWAGAVARPGADLHQTVATTSLTTLHPQDSQSWKAASASCITSSAGHLFRHCKSRRGCPATALGPGHAAWSRWKDLQQDEAPVGRWQRQGQHHRPMMGGGGRRRRPATSAAGPPLLFRFMRTSLQLTTPHTIRF